MKESKSPPEELYDFLIIGSGPAGLSAALYAARFKLKVVVLGKALGGMAAESPLVENYPGYRSITGSDLVNKMLEQVQALGVEVLTEEVLQIKKEENFKVTCASQKEFFGKTILLAMGTERRRLNIPGEKEFLGKGVSYCAICDAPLFRDKTVAVVGGSDAAAVSALMLAEYAKKVYIIYRGETLRAEPVMLEKIKAQPKVETIYKTTLCEIRGEAFVKKIVLDNPHQGSKELDLDGLFVEIGGVPNTVLAAGLSVEVSESNLIKVDPSQETNVTGVYAAGDITNAMTNLRQIITAAAQGVVASASAYRRLLGKGEGQVIDWGRH